MDNNFDIMENVVEPCAGPEYDSPNNSVWVVAVDVNQEVHILSCPAIHEGFFDDGKTAEMLGLPFEGATYQGEPAGAGVYKWTCSFHMSTDWESGQVDDSWFEVEKEELLWKAEGTL